MAKKKKRGQKQRKSVDARKRVRHRPAPIMPVGDEVWDRLEFLRNGVALLPDSTDEKPGIAYLVHGAEELPVRNCTCKQKKRCNHLAQLMYLSQHTNLLRNNIWCYQSFLSSVWNRLAEALGEDNLPLSAVRVEMNRDDGDKVMVFNGMGSLILVYTGRGDDRKNFLERLGHKTEDTDYRPRFNAISVLKNVVRTENENLFNKRGFRTKRQILEAGFWYLFAYHAFRDIGISDLSFSHGVDQSRELYFVQCQAGDGHELFRITLNNRQIRKVNNILGTRIESESGPVVYYQKLRPRFRLTTDEQGAIVASPFIEMQLRDGSTRRYALNAASTINFETRTFVKELNLLVDLDTGPLSKLQLPLHKDTRFTGDEFPSLLMEHGDLLRDDIFEIDPNLPDLAVHSESRVTTLHADAIDRDWCWLSVNYGFGDSGCSLWEILESRAGGKRFLRTDNGWVDTETPQFDDVEAIVKQVVADKRADKDHGLQLSRLELLRLMASSAGETALDGADEAVAPLQKILNLEPLSLDVPIDDLMTPLRDYQKNGLQWLRFLYENRLGGLLCDDMGLGKTHQAMALVALLRKQDPASSSLIVCPTTVISHWHEKMNGHLKTVKADVYHGNKRDLERSLADHHAIITSYGILRNDIDDLNAVGFSLAIFDEAQNLKNKQTQSYAAAANLAAAVKIGLTGTPIENQLIELKSLFDIVLPGYLGTDHSFDKRYQRPLDAKLTWTGRHRLRRFIEPFTLRRTKATVLDELPEKIEDIRYCTLSAEQVRLYRDAISTQGNALRNTLETSGEPIPYIHIFAALNLLKQICNHPALLTGDIARYQDYSSGKWELFKELMQESLESDQKVVVFTQYLGMIEMMSLYLDEVGVDYAVLTGTTRKRGDAIARFNEDTNCRVFLGSLKAGGTGIDLVAGSVAIHYDRWWNAAREDQATDRLHRIGQKRVVQVFKLVTRGTLEEKISLLIEKKRKLMNAVVKEDDPNVLKTLTRDELLEILADVAATE